MDNPACKIISLAAVVGLSACQGNLEQTFPRQQIAEFIANETPTLQAEFFQKDSDNIELFDPGSLLPQSYRYSRITIIAANDLIPIRPKGGWG